MHKGHKNGWRTQWLISRLFLLISILILAGLIVATVIKIKGGRDFSEEEAQTAEAENQTQSEGAGADADAIEQFSAGEDSFGSESADGAADPTAASDTGGEKSSADGFGTTDGSGEGAEESMPTEEMGEIPTDDETAQNSGKTETKAGLEITAEDRAVAMKKANLIVSEMSLSDRVYQMFMLTPEQLTGASEVTAAGDTTKSAYEKRPVGGVIYFAQNLKDPDQTKEMLGNMQKIAEDCGKPPLFLGVDEEGGRVARIGSNPAFGVKKVPAAAKLEDEAAAMDAGLTIGTYLKDLGFNLDFAPDADVLSNSNNTVIGDRSFGNDAYKVTMMARAFSDGLHKAGILSCYKHFPGHGATSGDTHNGYDYTDRTKEQLISCELVPFQNAGADGADFVMVSHISLTQVPGGQIPASLSEEIVHGILKDELHYDGLIITDSLRMGAVTQTYDSGQAAVMAIQAGADVLLMPQNFQQAYDAVIAAIDNGLLTEERINYSAARIVCTKILMSGAE